MNTPRESNPNPTFVFPRIPGRHRQPEFTQHQTQALEYDLVVFSHLRWEFVFQRPQHIISRLAEQMKILFVEEPIPYFQDEEDTAHLKTSLSCSQKSEASPKWKKCLRHKSDKNRFPWHGSIPQHSVPCSMFSNSKK
jgi:hypothetical protein